MAQVSFTPGQWLLQDWVALFFSGIVALRTTYLPNQFKLFHLRPLILFP